MTAQIIDGKTIATTIEARLKARVQKLKKKNIRPRLGVIYVGADRPSQTYIRKKQEAAERVGVEFELFQYPATIKRDQLVTEINKIQTQQKQLEQ
jgi:methylenetetrahydrofolate dehydrogenase (NADP+)/methenyltetrahydrofolate cyclohydrolase